jgi:hypothetical protein
MSSPFIIRATAPILGFASDVHLDPAVLGLRFPGPVVDSWGPAPETSATTGPDFLLTQSESSLKPSPGTSGPPHIRFGASDKLYDGSLPTPFNVTNKGFAVALAFRFPFVNTASGQYLFSLTAPPVSGDQRFLRFRKDNDNYKMSIGGPGSGSPNHTLTLRGLQDWQVVAVRFRASSTSGQYDLWHPGLDDPAGFSATAALNKWDSGVKSLTLGGTSSAPVDIGHVCLWHGDPGKDRVGQVVAELKALYY